MYNNQQKIATFLGHDANRNCVEGCEGYIKLFICQTLYQTKIPGMYTLLGLPSLNNANYTRVDIFKD